MSTGAWNPIWDAVFTGRAWGKYPSEELVAFVSRTFGSLSNRGAVRLLELGCGPGANVWFMAREGYQVSGVDGSKVAIQRASDRLASEGLEADLRVGDLLSLPFEDNSFHGVFDIAAIQHNVCRNQHLILAEARRVLRPGGKLFAILIGAGSWGEESGTEIEPGTFEELAEGPAAGGGTIHFFKEAELPQLFDGFSELNYERSERTWMGRTEKIVHWIVTAVK